MSRSSHRYARCRPVNHSRAHAGDAVFYPLLEHDDGPALVAPDHERERFTTIDRIASQNGLKIAALNLPYYVNLMQRHFPNLEMVAIRSPRQFFKAEPGTFDALLYSAEGGFAWTLVYPSFSVVVPKPNRGSASLALGLPLGTPQLQTFVDAWLLLKKQEGFIDDLSRYWIHGQGAKRREPRWSIMRDVLGWEPGEAASPALFE